MKLVYINEVGEDWTGNNIYEFLFADEIENIDGDDWDALPASGRPSPPSSDFIVKVGKLTSELKFELVQKSDTFAVWDAVDGVVALGWEDISEYDEYPDTRLYFDFGIDIKIVEDRLYEKDTVLEYNEMSKKVTDED
jgi:hypothetical protein